MVLLKRDTFFSIFGELIYASKTTWFEDKMTVCFHQVNDEESVVKVHIQGKFKYEFDEFKANVSKSVHSRTGEDL